MKHKAFIALVIVSLVVAAAACYGHFGVVGPEFGYVAPAGNGQVTIRGGEIITDHGRLEIAIYYGTGSPPAGTSMGLNIFFRHGFALRTPPAWRGFLDFE